MLWYFLQPGNWLFVLVIMALTTLQLGATSRAYDQLLKDKAVIAAEVMYEYDTRVSSLPFSQKPLVLSRVLTPLPVCQPSSQRHEERRQRHDA